jgi:hypothetical protein
LLCACLSLPAVQAGVPEDPEAWLESDAEPQGLAVNEGALEFLAGQPAGRVLRTSNWLTISAASLVNGWVELRQCQGNLDPVDKVEIVYRYRSMRKLRVLSARGVGSARIEGDTVQLTQVRAGAEVCIAAEVQVLMRQGDSRYALQSGPFHRRFLDGYYPVHLVYRVVFPPDLLVLETLWPPGQPGFSVEAGADGVRVDALFEGRLSIRLVLRREPLPGVLLRD